MRKYLISLLCILSISGLFFHSQNTLASHLLGADITYTYVTTSQYLVKLRVYRDCVGVSFPSNINICYSSQSAGYSSVLQLQLIGSGSEIPSSPLLPPVISSCNGGTGLGIERYEYYAMLSLPFTAHDWQLSYTSPDTLLSTGNPVPAINVTTRIDNVNYPLNSSVNFVFNPVFVYCVQQPSWDNLSAIDQDNDSIVYSLITTPLDSVSCPPQAFPNSNLNIYSAPATIDPIYVFPANGILYMTPTQIQVAHVSIKAEEFRNGTLINETILTHQVDVFAGCFPTSLQDIFETSIKIYPTVSTEIITVESEKQLNISEVLIYDSRSTHLRLIDFNQNDKGLSEINVSSFAAGIYFLKFVLPGKVIVRKFVKI